MATNNSWNSTDPVNVVSGGTGLASLTAHGILVGEGTSNVNPIVLTNGQFLIGSTGADPSAATLSGGTNITVTPGAGSASIALSGQVAVANGGTGLASLTAHGILVGEGTSAVNPITLTNGQLLIGSTGADPSAASLTAGTNITITPGAGSITISAASSAVTWNDTTGTSATLAPANNYVADNAALVTFTLPASAAIGDSYTILGKGAGGWLVAQNSGQSIHLGSATTTTGTGGSLASSNQWDALTLTCVTANTVWSAYAVQGNITFV